MVTQVNSWRRKRVDNGYTEKTQKGGGSGRTFANLGGVKRVNKKR